MIFTNYNVEDENSRHQLMVDLTETHPEYNELIHQLEEFIDNTVTQCEEFEDIIDDYKREAASLEDRENELNDQIDELTEQLETVTDERDELKDIINKMEEN